MVSIFHTSPNVNTRLANIHHPKHFPLHREKTIDQKGCTLYGGSVRSNRVIHRPKTTRLVLHPPRKGTESGRHSGVRCHSFSKRGTRTRTQARTRRIGLSNFMVQGGEERKRGKKGRFIEVWNVPARSMRIQSSPSTSTWLSLAITGRDSGLSLLDLSRESCAPEILPPSK